MTEMQLLVLFSLYDDEYFDGELPIPEFKVINSYRTLGEYSTYPCPDGHYGDVIKISDNYDYTESQLKDIMVHEMIHMYLMHFGIDKKCSHGKEFKKMMNDFNKRFGLGMRVTSDPSQYKVNQGKSEFMKTLCTLF